ncbi:MAG: sugar phosphate nucleotidyltransferase [Candidatus Saccharimonas sp.]
MITKAIIPVAGWGTRRLPITKTIEKCMLPIGNRPLVDYVVQDCLVAGITELIFIVGEDSTQLQDYYRSNIKLKDYLERSGRAEMLPLIAPLKGVALHFVTQPSHGKHGTAAAIGLAAEYLNEGESAVVLGGDDFIYNPDGSSEVQRLIDATPAGECGLIAVEVSGEDVSRYGVIVKNDEDYYERMVEKPAPEDAPSNLINPSKYILTKEVCELARTIEPDAKSGEYYIIDAINQYVQRGGKMKVHMSVGQYLDGGSVKGWLHANRVVLGDT